MFQVSLSSTQGPFGVSKEIVIFIDSRGGYESKKKN